MLIPTYQYGSELPAMFPWWKSDLLRHGPLHSCVIQLTFRYQTMGTSPTHSQLFLLGHLHAEVVSSHISRHTSASTFGVILAREEELKKQLIGEEEEEGSRLWMRACLSTILQRTPCCCCCCRLMRAWCCHSYICAGDWTIWMKTGLHVHVTSFFELFPVGVSAPAWQMTADTTRENSSLRER